MEFFEEKKSLRERLIIAGIDEIAEHGITDFSLRRVAAVCNTSCAAPYKHFKNKDELILEIIAYINSQWVLLKTHILEIFRDDSAKALTEVCIAYIRFWIANPNYRTILAKSGRGFLSDSSGIKALVSEYCDENSIDGEERERKIFAVTAFIYGTTSMLEHEELPNDDTTFAFVRKTIAEVLNS